MIKWDKIRAEKIRLEHIGAYKVQQRMLILSKKEYNSISENSDQSHVYCSVLSRTEKVRVEERHHRRSY